MSDTPYRGEHGSIEDQSQPVKETLTGPMGRIVPDRRQRTSNRFDQALKSACIMDATDWLREYAGTVIAALGIASEAERHSIKFRPDLEGVTRAAEQENVPRETSDKESG